MPPGYTGKILHVDLTSGGLSVETPSEAFYRQYVGGSAMGVYYLLTGMAAHVDAFSPENVITFMLSPLTGAPVSGQSRATVNARSPLVDGVGDSQMGGFFPAVMKFAGFDGVVITGQAATPVYLWLHEGEAELRPAGHLWGGKTTSEVETLLRSELQSPDIEIAQCGLAGERLVRLATVMNMANRAAGRTGMGAVMGSKRLKAVVVRGQPARRPAGELQRLMSLARRGVVAMAENPAMQGLHTYGTAGILSLQNAQGSLPARNYTEGQFAEAAAISGEALNDAILKTHDTCYACVIRCKRVVETEWMNHPVEPKHGGPEYETLFSFGAACGVSDLNAIAYANKLCNEYGLDTLGTGATIAWAIESYTRGEISTAEAGFPLQFGDAQGMVRLIEMIAHRDGLGHILAEGSRRAAYHLEAGVDNLATVKGAEVPGHSPHAKRSLGLIYAVNPYGADHRSSEHDPVGGSEVSPLVVERLGQIGAQSPRGPGLDAEKVRFALKTQHFYSFTDSADLCQFVFGPGPTLYGPAEALELLQAVTGWQDFSMDDLLTVGERRLNLLRLFNAREGLTRQDDKLPDKFFKALGGSGPTAGVRLDRDELERAKDTYYELAGWDQQTGNPLPETLARLGLAWAN